MHLRTPAANGGGFTLIELMVTVAVAAILTAIAIPAWRSFEQNDRMMSEAFMLRASMDLARAEAVKEDASVSVCASSDSLTCSSNNWANGWIVLSSQGGAPLQVVPAAVASNTITEHTGPYSMVTFLSTGLTNLAANAQYNICDTRGGAYARAVQVSVMGRVSSAPQVGQNLAGQALTCP
ncbi:MAG TPA: GspH/FimT family pseudopilin [Steroidobacteraceae bacterium]|nr:GspH/FimT family pseudopilin [Steroidobacteraceae bacterium]